VPVRGGYRVQFDANGRAVVPDDVADVLIGLGAGFYSLAGTVAEMLTGAKVLVIRDNGLGDLLLTTPLIRRLAVDHSAAVDVLTLDRYRCLFEGNPHVRQTLDLESDRGDRSAWDVTLDLRLIVENAELAGVYRHRADAFAEFGDIRLTPEERTLDFFLKDEEREAGKRFHCSSAPSRGVIGYVWRSSTRNRNWSREMHLQVLGALWSAGYSIVLIDQERQRVSLSDFAFEGPVSPTYAPYLCDLTGKLHLRGVASVMATCDAIVTPDTGLFHLAGALGVPTVAYFGAMPVSERAAHRTLRVVNNMGACGLLPCRSYNCLNFDEHQQSRCLSVSPGEVVAAVKAAIQEGKVNDATGNRMAGPTAQRHAQASDTDGNGAGELSARLGHVSGADDPVRDSAADGQTGLRTGGRGSKRRSRPVLQPKGE
jgi:ADP-heptose:LPS heptosyltransferase